MLERPRMCSRTSTPDAGISWFFSSAPPPSWTAIWYCSNPDFDSFSRRFTAVRGAMRIYYGLAGTGGSRISERAIQLGVRQRLAHTVRGWDDHARWEPYHL